MASTELSQALVALRRLLGQANTVQAKVDAMVALSQRQVWLATWAGRSDSRMVTRSQRQEMPLFTGMDTLLAAAEQQGWATADGSVPMLEVSLGDALSHALSRGAHLVIVDVGSPHELEIANEEIDSLSVAAAKRVGEGPYGIGSAEEENLREAVRRSSRPPSPGSQLFGTDGGPEDDESASSVSEVDAALAALEGKQSLPREARAGHEEDDHARVTMVGYDTRLDETVRFEVEGDGSQDALMDRMTPRAVPAPHILSAVRQGTLVLDDLLLDQLAAALRAFPEVEWACAMADDSKGAAIGLRVMPEHQQRLGEIYEALGKVVEQREGELAVLLLAGQDAVRRAREEGMVFYPGRRRSLIP